ncbi:MAG: carboxynorspermidine decarboxylase [Lachnospiraceae bacterium]|nr:carboxynorspermidine decarboxylase [Lachnospiraceae bacterium]
MKYEDLRTPSYIVSEGALLKNLKILKDIQDKALCKILLAQKAFSMYKTYPLISKFLIGTTASGLFEARLAFEEFGDDSLEIAPENHVFEPAYKDDELREICEIATHVYFNSISQLERFRYIWEPYQKEGRIKVALRINPELSTQEGHEIYDPCGKCSRLGIRLENMPTHLPEGVTGIHFHTLCEQGSEPLDETFKVVEEKFGTYLKEAEFINMGGGHHITKDDYNRELLLDVVKRARENWGLEVYLEPGEAIAINAGTLITRVLDIVETTDYPTLILDASAACHMPDVLEMPYTPPLFDALEGFTAGESIPEDAGERDGVIVRLASRTCLAGDIIGIYRFNSLPKIGDILTFGDMAIYSMVKNNTFNGMALPDIVLEHDMEDDNRFEIVKHFTYSDFKERLS